MTPTAAARRRLQLQLRLAAALGAACLASAPARAAAQAPAAALPPSATPPPAATDPAAPLLPAPEDPTATIEELATNSAPPAAPLVMTGYVDVGFADAQGDGTSFHPADTRAPLDYGVDAFAPAVNSRGEAASTDPGRDALGNPRFVNGFLPRSAGIGGTPSFLLNTASVDLRYLSPELPVMVFTRMHLLPRLDSDGETTRLLLEQAFGRIAPIKSAELAISAGKFDPVFGIEYLESQANFRVGITPSLFARYTTGTSVGIKAFYRYQLVKIASAISINASATNSGPFVEALQGSARSLTGVPVGGARLGYELNLPRASIKTGASVSYGPRNDQLDREATQLLWGIDLRVYVAGLSVWGEYIRIAEQEGSGDGKLTGTGSYTAASQFYARGFWLEAAYELRCTGAPFRLTPYARYERRHGEFVDFAAILVDRVTAGLNLGIGESLQVKAEYLLNRELEGAPTVRNNVFTSSVVWTW